MPSLEDEFGDILGKARTGLGFSLDELARRTGIARAALAAMEQYTRHPTPEEVQAIAEVLQLNAANLLAIAEERWHPQPWDQHHDPDAEVIRWEMPVGAYSVYCYLLRCRHTGAAAVIDTGGHGDRVVAQLRQHQIRPTYLLVTHEHGDHIGGLDLLHAETGAPILAGLSANVPNSRKLADGETLILGNLELTAYHTPGHTSGCVAYVTGKTAFVGDTLFAGSAGRANYAYTVLLQSIRDKIYSWDDDVHLFPGHGPVTTVGQEKRHNPFVTG